MALPEKQELDIGSTSSVLGFTAKDEMNLAEFPIALVTDRVPAGEKTIRFQDQIFDERKGQLVARRLVITASDEYGLPAAKDDDVILGLIQLTRRANNFTERMVRFSRSDLIRLLAWPDTGPSYRRLSLAFHRWLGVSLHYDNAWWDKTQERWTTLGFHILESFKLCSEGGGPRGQLELPLSRFTWNEDLFRSFQAGYLKQLDLDFYLGLSLPTSKRIYRFLDKRFYHRDVWTFDLKDFALHHVGLSRNYEGNTQLARKLEPAIRELEEKGFLSHLEQAERFKKVSSRKWLIKFVRQRPAKVGSDDADAIASPELVEELTKRDVTPSTARMLVATFPAERIREKLAEHDWLLGQKDGRVLRSPAGYLVQSIREDYQCAYGFKLQVEKSQRDAANKKRARQIEEARAQREAERERLERELEAKTQALWDSLSQLEQNRLLAEALASSPRFFVERYREHENTGTEMEDRYRKIILHPRLVTELEGRGESVPFSN